VPSLMVRYLHFLFSLSCHHHLRAPIPAAMATLHQVPLLLLSVSVHCRSLGIILADAILQLRPVPLFLMRGTTLCGHHSVVCISVAELALMNPFFMFSVHAVRHDFMYPLQRTRLHVSFMDLALACSKTQYAVSTENPDVADEVDL